MADLSIQDVLKLARLSKITLSSDEVQEFTGDINNIIHYVEQLSKVDTTGLEPTSQVTGLMNVSRPDEIIDYGYGPEDLLNEVPGRDGDYIKTKRVIE